jgi:uncharacterized membrane protein
VTVDAWALDWLGLALRWFHLVVGIGWIGASLYFMWLDASLQAPRRPEPGVVGEVWMVHSGGFYQVVRRKLGPGELPAPLHWFRWEAALTAASGLLLLIAVYYVTGGVYLVDPMVARLTPAAAVAIGVGSLVAGWLVYDLLWRSPLGRGHARLATALSWVLLVAAGWALTRLLSGRAAFIHVGALLGVMMAANVWMHIVPAQRELIAATREGRPPDWSLGEHAKRRSTHNSYVTFPVIFTMFSHHYPAIHGHRLNWLLLALLVVVGAGIRHFMITQEHRRPAAWVWGPVAAALVVLALATWPPRGSPSAATPRPGERPVPFSVVRGIVDLRCTSCHATRPTDDVFRVAPNGVVLDTAEGLRVRAATIKERVVGTRTMPLANKTGMTDEERALLGRWIDQGARGE